MMETGARKGSLPISTPPSEAWQDTSAAVGSLEHAAIATGHPTGSHSARRASEAIVPAAHVLRAGSLAKAEVGSRFGLEGGRSCREDLSEGEGRRNRQTKARREACGGVRSCTHSIQCACACMSSVDRAGAWWRRGSL